MDICTMPRLRGNLGSTNPADWWDNSEIVLWTDWEHIDVNAARLWQLCINKRFSEGDRTASTWLKEFVYNSPTDTLRTAVTKKYNKLPPNQQGGITYLYFTLTEMFHMSREVEDAMFTFLDLFKRKGVARYTGKNVRQISEEVLGVCKRLHAINALRTENVMDVLQGLSICGNERFRGLFKLLKQNADLDNLHVLPGITAKSTKMEKIEAIFDRAVDLYDSLCTTGNWNKAERSGLIHNVVKMVAACWNCGAEDHSCGACPKPKNQDTINKNKKAFMEKKSAGRRDGGRGTRPPRGSDKPKDGKDKSDPNYQRKVWEAAGLHMVNGSLMVKCKTCGLNSTHTTKFHAAWESNPSSFRLPSTHMYITEKARLAAASSSQPPPVYNQRVPADAAAGGNNAGVSGAAGFLSISRADLESRLANLERNSTNPNASEMSDFLRSLLLN
jgi:hypothetical protein